MPDLKATSIENDKEKIKGIHFFRLMNGQEKDKVLKKTLI